jgi:hypothetical protein
MYLSMYLCSVKMATNNSRNVCEWFTIHGQVRFVGNELYDTNGTYYLVEITSQYLINYFK